MMAARRSDDVLLVLTAVAALLSNSLVAASPVTYTVGDILGWTVPRGSPNAYQAWSNSITFHVDDILVFNFVNGTHTVAQVTKQAYNSCDTSNPVSLFTNPPVRITLTTAGDHYFISTVSGDCSSGMKVTITVVAAGTPPSASPPTTTPSSNGAPAPQSVATPPSSSSLPPSGSAHPPTAGATTPSSSTTPPPQSASAPSSSATPPPSGATTPSGSTETPAANSPAGGAATPRPGSAPPSLGVSGFFTTFLAVVVAFSLC